MPLLIQLFVDAQVMSKLPKLMNARANSMIFDVKMMS